MCSHGIAFVSVDVTQEVLEVIPDGVAAPIFEVACCSYSLLMRAASRAFDCSSDWMQASFTTWELGAYLEGPIWTRRANPMLMNLTSTFQVRLAVAALHLGRSVQPQSALDLQLQQGAGRRQPIGERLHGKGHAPKAMQFGVYLDRLLQKNWDADPVDGLVWLSKWDRLDAFHQCNLHQSDARNFAFVVPPLQEYPSVLLRIYLVLPIGWVISPNFFCATSKTVANTANGYALESAYTFVVYPPRLGRTRPLTA